MAAFAMKKNEKCLSEKFVRVAAAASCVRGQVAVAGVAAGEVSFLWA
jgi:hypothetical protein